MVDDCCGIDQLARGCEGRLTIQQRIKQYERPHKQVPSGHRHLGVSDTWSTTRSQTFGLRTHRAIAGWCATSLVNQVARKNQLAEERTVSVGTSIVKHCLLVAPPARGDRLDRRWDHHQGNGVARIARRALEVASTAILKQVGVVRTDPRRRYSGDGARGESALEVPKGRSIQSTQPVGSGVAAAGMLPTDQATATAQGKRANFGRRTANKETPPPLGVCSLAQQRIDGSAPALCQRWRSVGQNGWVCGTDGMALVAHG